MYTHFTTQSHAYIDKQLTTYCTLLYSMSDITLQDTILVLIQYDNVQTYYNMHYYEVVRQENGKLQVFTKNVKKIAYVRSEEDNLVYRQENCYFTFVRDTRCVRVLHVSPAPPKLNQT